MTKEIIRETAGERSAQFESARRVYEALHMVAPVLVTLQRQLFDAGLLETAQAVNAASQKLGWEAARKVGKS